MLIVIPCAILFFVSLLTVLFVEALRSDKNDIHEKELKHEKHLYKK